MKCEGIRRHFSEYIDHEAEPEIAQAIQAHTEVCGDCRRALEDYRHFQAAFFSVGEEELPFDFSIQLRQNLAEEQSKVKQKKNIFNRPWTKVVLAACACFVLVLGLLSAGASLLDFGRMGASSSQAAPMDTGYNSAPSGEFFAMMDSASGMDLSVTEEFAVEDGFEAEMPMSAPEAAEGMKANMNAAVYGSSGPRALEEADEPEEESLARKIIKDYSLSLRVDDFDGAYQQISELAEEYGGYVVSGNSYDYEGSTSRDGWLSIRVDAKRANEAVARISELGFVENNSFSSNDVTSEYYDIKTRLEQYRAQEERLLELYEMAGSIEDLIALESEMTRVIAEIESMEGSLRSYDQLTTLSLIEINLYTPSTYTQTVEPTGWSGFWENMKSGFLRGVNGLLDWVADLFIFVVRILPTLVFLAVIGFGLVWILRSGKRKEKKARKKNGNND